MRTGTNAFRQGKDMPAQALPVVRVSATIKARIRNQQDALADRQARLSDSVSTALRHS